MGFFGAAIVILYLKQIRKLYESRDSLHFLRQSANFAILGNTDLGSISRQILIFLTFLELLRIALINMFVMLIILSKIATPVLLKIKVFVKKLMTS